MNFSKYLKDKIPIIILFLFIYIIILLMLLAFKINTSLIIIISLLLFLFMIMALSIEYFRRKNYYQNLLGNINVLDQAYLVLETLNKPEFLDGEILYQALYEINKSIGEYINQLSEQMDDFKEYIELWIHEVKIPLASLTLMVHNHSDEYSQKFLDQLKRLENYVDQVLYYVRSENAEKDFLIKKTSLKRILNNTALKYKDDLLERNITLIIDNIDYQVYTDAKWLEYILGQIISNSIKYQDTLKDSNIKISVKEDASHIKLIIEDNGIGIADSDLPQVFKKSFTGKNGRIINKSTGMGLYIVKNLCEKMGHLITIESSIKKYNKVIITFAKNQYYEVTK